MNAIANTVDGMANPRVFVSSTCYDLLYIRENLKFFIKNMGFEPVLSEEGNVFYNPEMPVEDSCLAEVKTCHMFVLIIGGHSGHSYKSEPQSITNQEYRTAIDAKIPVFAMVEHQVNAEYRVYKKNKEKLGSEWASNIIYPGVDTAKIFEFMDEVQSNALNNALVPFSDFNHLEAYLKQQWAGMMYNYLIRRNERARLADTLATLRTMNTNIEFIAKQILSSVGGESEKLSAELVDEISQFFLSKYPNSKFLPDLYDEITISEVLRAPSILELTKKHCSFEIIKQYYVFDFPHSKRRVEKSRLRLYETAFEELSKKLADILRRHNSSIEKYQEHPK